MQELQLETLTSHQKLGMTMCAYVPRDLQNPNGLSYILELIRNHSLGAVWIQPPFEGLESVMKQIKAAADYPILIFCDVESGFGSNLIGKHNAIGCTGREDLAYIFGKVTAVNARKMGYNVLCAPILDMAVGNMVCGGNVRALGSDKYKVTALAAAEARGLRDGGVLTVAKHYPGHATGDDFTDTHMAESCSDETVEELLDYNLYPYLELIRADLLDGMMVKHSRFTKIDPHYPASLSRTLIQLIRDHGFHGFTITDALCMMGVVAKFGQRNSIGLAVANGNSLALPYMHDNRYVYQALCDCYDEGMISDAVLDEAVSYVLAAQRKTLDAPKDAELTEDDLKLFARINRDTVYAKTDDGISVPISKDGKHCFVILTETALDLNNANSVAVDTFSGAWYRPFEIADLIRARFPQSEIRSISEYPSPTESSKILSAACEFDDVVWITFFNSRPYIGTECFTSRILAVMDAMQITNQISTVVHFGNPFVLEDVPHVPRVLIGTTSADNIASAMDVLAGDYPANGTLTYKVDLK